MITGAVTRMDEACEAVMDRLAAEADGGLLQGVQVDYGVGELGLKSIYGGGARFDQESAIAEQAGVLNIEQITYTLYIRCVRRPGCDVRLTDRDAAGIKAVIARVFAANPQLGGDMTWLGVSSGSRDYSRNDQETVSVHALDLLIQAYVSWRP